MDKYEFNIKVEQIKKLVNKGDYETAMKIADTIDWRRVRNANLLALVAEIYENNEEYQEAREVLLLAYERAPIGKRLLYKLAYLALKENNLKEAEDYYREFCDLAPEDPRQYLLRYQILKAKKAPDEQLIHSLERYTSTELDEKWLYELAELYCHAGKEEECVQTCDKIMLMFGLGKYVEKAMQLKVQYAPLSNYQMDLIENRDKYEEKLRAVEQQFGDETREIMENNSFPVTEAGRSVEYDGVMETGPVGYGGMMEAGPAGYDGMMEAGPVGYDGGMEAGEAPPVLIMDEPVMEEEPAREMEINTGYQTMVEEMQVGIQQAEIEEKLAREMSKISVEEYREPGASVEQTKVIGNIREIISARSLNRSLSAAKEQAPAASVSPKADIIDVTQVIMPVGKLAEREEVFRKMVEADYLMIETHTAEKGLEVAVEVLKRLHRSKGTKCPVVKITGSKLSRKGVMESADKLTDKDLIIEEAGDLTVVALIELMDLIENTKIRVIMIDNPRQIESMIRINPVLGSLFTVITITEDGELKLLRSELAEEADLETAGINSTAVKGYSGVKQTWEEDIAEQAGTFEETWDGPADPEDNPADLTDQMAGAMDYEPAAGEWVAGVMPGDDLEAAEAEMLSASEEPSEDMRGMVMQNIQQESLTAAAMSAAAAVPEELEDFSVNSAMMESVEPLSQPMENLAFSGADEEMELHDFVEYTCKYASDIDCSITGKSMLALYERIEVMEENGIPLTKINAENLIEEAADKAEKFTFKKLFTGLFHPRYDKEGLLILREEHFMN